MKQKKLGIWLLLAGVLCLLVALILMITVETFWTSILFVTSLLLNTAGITLMRSKS
ncbi:hypothetical protein U6B65_14255 [Oscillospiraceae bacterium MB08-C2-2]|nr:hypothetical protein U6B65_14255 [Oscillospiraceae bacterium MB08-C2-2]